jgi:hypothetical protein
MAMWAEREAALGRGNREDDVNLTGPKNEEIPRRRFSWYKWMVKI